MSEPVNLNKIRKARAKVAKRTRADENAVRFGQSKAQKEAIKRQQDRAGAALEGHKRDG